MSDAQSEQRQAEQDVAHQLLLLHRDTADDGASTGGDHANSQHSAAIAGTDKGAPPTGGAGNETLLLRLQVLETEAVKER